MQNVQFLFALAVNCTIIPPAPNRTKIPMCKSDSILINKVSLLTLFLFLTSSDPIFTPCVSASYNVIDYYYYYYYYYITVFIAACRLIGGGVDVVVTRARSTVTTVVEISTNKRPAVAFLTVALIARCRPRLGHSGTERGQDGTDDHHGDRGEQTDPA